MEEIQSYGVEFDVSQSSYRKMQKFQDRMIAMHKKIQKAAEGMQMPSPTTTTARTPKTSKSTENSDSPFKAKEPSKRMEKMRVDALADVKRNLQHITEEQRTQMMNTLAQVKGVDELNRKIKDQKKVLRDENNAIASKMSASAREQVRMENLKVNALNDVKRNLEHITDLERQELAANLKTVKSERDLRNIIKDQKKVLMEKNRERRKETTELKKQHFLLQRMDASSKQFAGNMVSAFAAAAAGTFVTQTGQNFESVRNTMLAVSDSSEQAGQNMAFVKDEAFRLGLGLKESAKGFAKMVSARGEMSLEDTRQAFLGIAEMGTLLGLSADESGRAINALQQMMSKGVVSAEELKLQMGEVLPNAIQIMAKSAKDAGLTVNGTVKEMMDLQQQGGLISTKVLPHFAKNMREAAQANGALDKALASNRVAMNRFSVSMAEGADTVFQTGFGEGLTELFNTLGENIRDLNPLFKAFGRILGSTFKVIAIGVDLITPPLRFLGVILDNVTEMMGDFSFMVSSAFGVGIVAATGKLGVFAGSLAIVKKGFAAMLLPVMKVVGALALVEELLNALVFKDKKGLIFDVTKPDEGIHEKFTGNEGFMGHLGKAADFLQGSLLGTNLRGNIDQVLNAFNGGTNLGNGGQSQIHPTTVVLQVDKEKLGEVVMSTEAAEAGTLNHIHPLFVR